MEINLNHLIKKIPAINIFNRTMNTASLSQCYIITGGDDYLRNLFVNYAVSSLFCKNLTKPCLECIECEKIRNKTNVDVLYFGKDNEPIKKEQVQKIIEAIITKPFEHNEKTIIVNNFENISENNQNLLLKILEELPAFVKIFFVSDSMLKILPTIQSRSRIITLSNFTSEELTEIFPRTEYEKMIKCSNGKISNVIKYFENKKFLSYYNFADNLCSEKESNLLDIIAFLENNKNDIVIMLEIMQNILEEKLLENKNSDYLINLSKVINEQVNLLNTNTNKNIILDKIPIMIYRSKNANIRNTI